MSNNVIKNKNGDFTVEKTVPNIHKRGILDRYKNRPKKEILSLIKELIIEHNNKPTTRVKLSLKAHSIPPVIWKQVFDYFDNN